MKEEALYSFWSSFSIPAYEENSVYTMGGQPKYPYITYEVQTDSFGSALYLTASLWYRDTSWLPAITKKDEIFAYIGEGGKQLPITGGTMWIKRGRPFAKQTGDSTDDMIKRYLLNIEVEYFTEN